MSRQQQQQFHILHHPTKSELLSPLYTYLNSKISYNVCVYIINFRSLNQLGEERYNQGYMYILTYKQPLYVSMNYFGFCVKTQFTCILVLCKCPIILIRINGFQTHVGISLKILNKLLTIVAVMYNLFSLMMSKGDLQ